MVAESGSPPPQLVPRLEALLGLWRSHYGIQPIPDLARFAAFELGPWARHVAWIDALADDRHRIRGFGIELIRRFGREATNHLVEDLALDIATGLRRQLERTVATAAPAIGAASVQLGRDAAIFCDLVLPVAAAGGRVNQFLFASYELRKPLDMAVR
jgi:hypothetical protein